MPKFWEEIPESLIPWILDQKVFWVASAPLSGKGHINLSPKGGGPQGGRTFDVLDTKTFYYMDMGGSGAETIAHMREPGNGRITVQFNAFEGAPQIVRLWGKGRVLEIGTSEYDEFIKYHNVEIAPGFRAVIIVDVHQAGSSCGFQVPHYEFREYRRVLEDYFDKKEQKAAKGNEKQSPDRYMAINNSLSIDGLPGIKRAEAYANIYNIPPIEKMIGPMAPKRFANGVGYGIELLIFIALISFLIGLTVARHAPLFVLEAMEQGLEVPKQFKGSTVTGKPVLQSLISLWTAATKD